MDDNTKVIVKNTTKHPVTVILPDIRFQKVWPKDSEFAVKMEVLKEAVFDTGFQVFLEQGILYIPSKEARIELGLEEENAVETIKYLNKNQILKTLKSDTIKEFEDLMSKIPSELQKTIADIAIDENYIDIEKAKVIKAKTGIDVIQAIQLKIKNEE